MEQIVLSPRETVPEEKVYENVLVMHIGSNYLKIGMSADEMPQVVPHCLFTTNKYFSTLGLDYCTNRKTTDADSVIIEGEKIVKLKGLRKHLLEERKIIQKDSDKVDVTYKPIEIKDKLQLDSPVEKLKENSFVYGQDAIDASIEQEGLLFYPFSNGNFNTSTNRSIGDVSNFIEMIWSHYIHQFVPKNEISTKSVFLVIPEHHNANELEILLKILFQIGFEKAFVHTENVMASFGGGMDKVCVVDMGETTTSISVIEDGYSWRKSQILLHFGGYDVMQNLSLLMAQSGFERLSIDKTSDREALREIKDQGIHLQDGEEFIQLIKFHRGKQVIQVEMGDPLYLAALGYMDHSLFKPKEEMEWNSLDEWIIESFKRSEMDITTNVKKKSITRVDVLFVGGNSNIKGLATMLEKSLHAYYERTVKDSSIRVNVIPTKKELAMVMSWKGAVICSKLEASKPFWIQKKDFQIFGIRSAKDKLPFKI
jgi:actin-related protein 8